MTVLTEKVKIFTIGKQIFANIEIGPTAKEEMDSAFCNASCFGTSSPNTKVKYDNTIVITTTEIVFKISNEIGTPTSYNKFANGSAKKSAANALDKKPANVIHICMVLRKRDRKSTRLNSSHVKISY